MTRAPIVSPQGKQEASRFGVDMCVEGSVGRQIFVVFKGLHVHGTTVVRVKNMFKESFYSRSLGS